LNLFNITNNFGNECIEEIDLGFEII